MATNQDARPFVDLQKDAEEFRQKFDDDIQKCIGFLDAKITALICDPDSLATPSKKNAIKTNALVEFSKAKYEIFIGVKSLVNEMEREWLKYISEMKKLFIENVEIFLAGTKLEVKLPTSEFKSSPEFKKSPRKERSSIAGSLLPILSFAKNMAAIGSPLRNRDNDAAEGSRNATKDPLLHDDSNISDDDLDIEDNAVAQAQSDQLKKGSAKVVLSKDMPRVSLGRATSSPKKGVEDSSDSTSDSGTNTTRQSRSKARNEGRLSSSFDNSISGSRGRQKEDIKKSLEKNVSEVESHTRPSRSRKESKSPSSNIFGQMKKVTRAAIPRVASSSPKKYVTQESSNSESDSDKMGQMKKEKRAPIPRVASSSPKKNITTQGSSSSESDSDKIGQMKKDTKTSIPRVASSSPKKYITTQGSSSSESDSDETYEPEDNNLESNTRVSRSKKATKSSSSEGIDKFKKGSGKKATKVSVSRGRAERFTKESRALISEGIASSSSPKKYTEDTSSSESDSARNTSKVQSKPRASRSRKESKTSSHDHNSSQAQSNTQASKTRVESKSQSSDRSSSQAESNSQASKSRSSGRNASQAESNTRASKTLVESKSQSSSHDSSQKTSRSSSRNESKSPTVPKKIVESENEETSESSRFSRSAAKDSIRSTRSAKTPAVQAKSGKNVAHSVSKGKDKKTPAKQKLNPSVVQKRSAEENETESSSDKTNVTSDESATESNKNAPQSVSKGKSGKAPSKKKLNSSTDMDATQRTSRRGTGTEISAQRYSRSPKKVTFTPHHLASDDIDVLTPSAKATSSVRRKTLLPSSIETVLDVEKTPKSSRSSAKRKTIGGISDLAIATPPKRLKTSENIKSVSSSQDEETTDNNLLESDGNYSDWMALKSIDAKIPAKPGIYEIKVWRAKKPAYIGHCESLRQKLTLHKLQQNSGHKHLDKFIERNMNDIQIRFEVISSADIAKNEVKNRVKSFITQYKTTPAYN